MHDSVESLTFAAVATAAERLRGVVLRTPLLESEVLNRVVGGRVLVKAECLQRTGSFKSRGAFNRLAQMTPDEQRRGVVAYSSGNHAQAVAAAAAKLLVPATIFMPSDAPATKIKRTRSFGAEVVLYNRRLQDRALLAGSLAAERRAVLVPPYDDSDIIAGQGTLGLEIAEQTRELGVKPDAFIVGASGGGLAAGCGLALGTLLPETRLFTAEPSGFDDHARSLANGDRVANALDTHSICDALLATEPGHLTWPITHQHFSGGIVIDDTSVCRAMALAYSELKLVLEPSGAVGLAAILDTKANLADATTVVVATGGNVDWSSFVDCLSRAQGHCLD